MDSNVKWVNEQKIKRTIEEFSKNNINGYHAKDKKDVINIIEGILKEGDKVCFGGSMTLFETGVIEFLRSGNYNLLDRNKEGLTKEEVLSIYKEAFTSDVYFTSSNAITEDGLLYNVDGNGNRVAAMLYGPEKVIVIVGVNKIVKNLEEAINRNKYIAAPANAKRLGRNTPCAKVGYCMDCQSAERICNEYTVIKRQNRNDRMYVIIVEEEFGY